MMERSFTGTLLTVKPWMRVTCVSEAAMEKDLHLIAHGEGAQAL